RLVRPGRPDRPGGAVEAGQGPAAVGRPGVAAARPAEARRLLPRTRRLHAQRPHRRRTDPAGGGQEQHARPAGEPDAGTRPAGTVVQGPKSKVQSPKPERHGALPGHGIALLWLWTLDLGLLCRPPPSFPCTPVVSEYPHGGAVRLPAPGPRADLLFS